MFIVASVTINAGSLNWVMITPLKNPSSVPIKIPSKIATGMGMPLLTIKPTVSVPETATIAPTERSMPPKIITRVMPRARKTLLETCRSTVIKFSVVRNTGDTIDKITHKTSNTNIMPILPLTIDVRALFFVLIAFSSSCRIAHNIFLGQFLPV